MTSYDSSIRILIVEDEMIIAQEIADQLEATGYTVVDLVPRGEEALEAVREHRPDLILMDIHLKGNLDGIQTARLTKEINKVPIIFLTAYSQRDVVNQALEVEPAAYLTKPCRHNDLQIAIDLAFRNFQKQQPGNDPDSDSVAYFILQEAIFVRRKNRYVKLQLRNLYYLEAQRGYVNVVTPQLSEVFVGSLQGMLQQLNVPYLVQVHRSYVVNLYQVDAFEDTSLFMGEHEIPIGKTYRDEFIKCIRTLK